MAAEIDTKDVKALLIEKIKARGLPVLVTIDHMDSSATILVEEDGSVRVDDYGYDFIEESSSEKELTISDITDEGLLKLAKYGLTEDDDDYEDELETALEYL